MTGHVDVTVGVRRVDHARRRPGRRRGRPEAPVRAGQRGAPAAVGGPDRQRPVPADADRQRLARRRVGECLQRPAGKRHRAYPRAGREALAARFELEHQHAVGGAGRERAVGVAERRAGQALPGAGAQWEAGAERVAARRRRQRGDGPARVDARVADVGVRGRRPAERRRRAPRPVRRPPDQRRPLAPAVGEQHASVRGHDQRLDHPDVAEAARSEVAPVHAVGDHDVVLALGGEQPAAAWVRGQREVLRLPAQHAPVAPAAHGEVDAVLGRVGDRGPARRGRGGVGVGAGSDDGGRAARGGDQRAAGDPPRGVRAAVGRDRRARGGAEAVQEGGGELRRRRPGAGDGKGDEGSIDEHGTHRRVARRGSEPPRVYARLPQLHADVLQLRVGEQRLDALAAAVAGALHATERELDTAADPVGVDEHLARLDRGGDAVRAGEVARPDAGDEPVLGRVGEVDGLVLARERHRREHGTEHLLLEELHLRAHVGDERRLQEQALDVLAAGDDRRALLAGGGEHAGGALELALGDQRAEVRVLDPRADLDALQRGGDELDHLVIDGRLDQQPRARRAALAGVLDQRLDDRRHGGLEVRIREHHVRRLAAQLELDRGEPLRARSGDDRARRGAAHERHVVDPGVLGQRGADRAVAGRHPQHPVGDAAALGQLRQPQRRQRREL